MKQPPDLSTLSHAEKDALIMALWARVETQGEQIKELERRLNLNSTNSGKPPSTDGYQKPKPQNVREKSGKKSGGQNGHAGENLRQVETPDHVENHYPSACACGAALGHRQSTGYKKRQTFDLPKPQPIEVTEHRAHICSCGRCGKTTHGSFPDDVATPVQCGANIAALVVSLHSWQLVPEDRLAEMIEDMFGVALTTATIAAMVQRKAEAWTEVATHIGEQVKTAPVKNMDESGLRVAGILQWLHVAATTLFTFYRIDQKRGTMMAGVTGIIVHDPRLREDKLLDALFYDRGCDACPVQCPPSAGIKRP